MNGPTVTKDGERAPLPFYGSSLSYGMQATAYTFAPGAEPFYNPTWSHLLTLSPQWHFNDLFFVRGRFSIAQEITTSDDYNSAHQFVQSDTWIDFATTGYTEKVTGIQLRGDVRFNIPTSKVSLAQTRVLTVGPSLTVAKRFPVLQGLILSYSGRFNYRFNRYTGAVNDGPGIESACAGLAVSEECQQQTSTGRRNARFDIAHGPVVVFVPHERVSVSAAYFMTHLFLYPLSTTPQQYQGSNQLNTDSNNFVRHASLFDLSVSVQAVGPLSISLGAYTFTSQLNTEGKYTFPLINRFTTLYLDLSVDIEATVSKLL